MLGSVEDVETVRPGQNRQWPYWPEGQRTSFRIRNYGVSERGRSEVEK